MTGERKGVLSRRTVLKVTGAGAVGAVAFSGTASANCPCESVTLGKLDSNDIDNLERGTTSEFTLTLDGDLRIVEDCAACQGDKEVTVSVTPTEFKGSEPICVEIEIDDDNGACKCRDDGIYLSGAEVKGGPKVATYDCDDVVQENQRHSRIPDACAPVNDNNGKRYGVSNIVIKTCVFPNCYDEDTSCVNGGGE